MLQRTLTTVISFSVLLSCNPNLKDDTMLFTTAKEEIDKGEYNSAIEKLDTLIVRNNLNDSAYYYRGVALAKAGDNDNAIADFTHLIKIGSSLRNKSLQKRGNIYLDLSDFDKAFADYDLAIEGDPKDFFSFYVRGAIKTERKVFDKNKDTTYSRYEYTENGKFYYYDLKGALEDLNQAEELNPNYIDIFVKRGKVYEQLDKFDYALADYNKAVSIDGKYFDAFLARALLYKQLQNSSKSLQDFNSAIELEPKNPFPYINRGYLKRELLNDRNGACDDIMKAQSLGLTINEDDLKDCN
jgi:tetratricopeptide (TPR) repeat protein